MAGTAAGSDLTGVLGSSPQNRPQPVATISMVPSMVPTPPNLVSSNPGFSNPGFSTPPKTGSPITGSTPALPLASSPMKSISSLSGSTTPISATSVMSSPSVAHKAPVTTTDTTTGKVLDKRRLQELVKEVDPLEQMEDDVEEMLMQVADDFIDNVASAACQLAKHRKSNIVEVKDVQLHLERNWNMWIPGFGSDDVKPFKRSSVTEAHKQRLALIKKTLKKY